MFVFAVRMFILILRAGHISHVPLFFILRHYSTVHFLTYIFLTLINKNQLESWDQNVRDGEIKREADMEKERKEQGCVNANRKRKIESKIERAIGYIFML